MKFLGGCLAALVATIGFAHAASAATPLVTPPVYVLSTDSVCCAAVNTGATSIGSIVANAYDSTGTVVGSNTCANVGGTGGTCFTCTGGTTGYFSCQFIVTGGSKAKVRGEIELDPASLGGEPSVSLPAN